MICYVGLGGNLGDRVKNLRAALDSIKKIRSVELLRISSFYETAAWGVTNQPKFINAAAKLSTELKPPELLDKLQRIELELGRVRLEHWGARTIDLDLLLIEGEEINSERLTVPHPLLRERDFALVPLMEIFPSFEAKLHGEPVEKIAGSPKDFSLKLVACVDRNFGLGFEGRLLFRIPADMKNFRELTLNNTVIYGRKTLATLPNAKPLSSRRNIIFSRTLEISGAEIVHDVESLWRALKIGEKNFVIGGGEIFAELLPYAEEIFLTAVDAEVQADRFFPPIPAEFQIAAEKSLGESGTLIHFVKSIKTSSSDFPAQRFFVESSATNFPAFRIATRSQRNSASSM